MMRKIVLLFLVCVWPFMSSKAEVDSLKAASHLRISILTCSPGEEVWETFGHACIRIIDSAKEGGERDVIYNYGFFEASEDKTLWSQAFSGRVVDLLDTITYEELMYEYRIKKRGITEQVLSLSEDQKIRLLTYLKNNLKRENRYYEFDTFYDNCSTRIRDLLATVLGSHYVPGPALAPNSRITFRDVTVTTLCPQQHKYWFGFAVNMLYASRTDRVMTNKDAMFLPTLLCRSVDGATVDGHNLCDEKITIQADSVKWVSRLNAPFLISVLIAVVTVVSMLYRKTAMPAKMMSFLVLLCTGAMGWLILYTWHLDGEPAWKDNLNILWALPTNLVISFFSSRVRAIYAFIALGLIGAILILHLLRVQVLPLFEITPLILALLWVYGRMIYVKYSLKEKQ